MFLGTHMIGDWGSKYMWAMSIEEKLKKYPENQMSVLAKTASYEEPAGMTPRKYEDH